MKPTLLVLAAGMGSRYGGLKQIDPVGENGETIIDYSIYDAVKSGFARIVFVIRKDIENDFRNIIGRKYEDKIDVEYVFQELECIPEGFSIPSERTKPWGTGHAILVADKVIDAPFAVINGDDFYGTDSFNLLFRYLNTVEPESENYAIVGYLLKNTLSDHGYVSRGICGVKDEKYLANIEEFSKIEKKNSAVSARNDNGDEVELSGNEFVSMNMLGFTKRIFEHLDSGFRSFLKSLGSDPKSEFYIPTMINNLIQSNVAKVEVLKTTSAWLGITYKEDKEHVKNSVKKLVQSGQYPSKLWE